MSAALAALAAVTLPLILALAPALLPRAPGVSTMEIGIKNINGLIH